MANGARVPGMFATASASVSAGMISKLSIASVAASSRRSTSSAACGSATPSHATARVVIAVTSRRLTEVKTASVPSDPISRWFMS